MSSNTELTLDLTEGGYWRATFHAMASPCVLLIECDGHAAAQRLASAAATEARRIEQKYSRYLPSNIVHAINASGGCPVEVDAETAELLNFASRCWELSDGAFDITSGVLRRAWRFDGSDNVPSQETIAELLPLVGWARVGWHPPQITLPEGMEIDFGGVGKEYAVDRVAELLLEGDATAALVNFGGDIAVRGARGSGAGWEVGVETRGGDAPAHRINIHAGGLATSGDARRFLERDGTRYGHVLDPRTGWPAPGAPRSVTVLASSCTEAGLLSTLGMLNGSGAEAFLEAQGVKFWCQR